MFIYYFKNISNMQETMSTLVLKKRHHINFFLSAKKKTKKMKEGKQNTQKIFFDRMKNEILHTQSVKFAPMWQWVNASPLNLACT